MTELNRGVAVDAQGYFVGAFTWPTGTPSPKLNSKGTPKAEQLKLLLTEAALAVPSEKARWDFATETWSLPTERFFVVDEATGRKVSGSLQWRERLPGLRPGLVYVEVPPPAATSRKPLWNSEARAWEFPRRVALIDEDGLCANVALENPMTTTPDVEVPAGWPRPLAADDLLSGPDCALAPGGGGRFAPGVPLPLQAVCRLPAPGDNVAIAIRRIEAGEKIALPSGALRTMSVLKLRGMETFLLRGLDDPDHDVVQTARRGLADRVRARAFAVRREPAAVRCDHGIHRGGPRP